MFRRDIKEKYIRKESWVKDLLKTYNPELLADLIAKRIKSPAIIGPFIQQSQNESPTDIINCFIDEGPEDFRGKIEPAVGLLLFNMMYDKMNWSHDLFRGVFSIIEESKLTNCSLLLGKWIDKHYSIITSKEVNDSASKWRETYRSGLIAFAKIQSKNSLLEKFWLDMWNSNHSYWWAVAFNGLMIQNPDIACKELHLLVSRKLERWTPYLLYTMWRSEYSRDKLQTTLKESLYNNVEWGGILLNTLLGKLNDDNKKQLLSSLKKE